MTRNLALSRSADHPWKTVTILLPPGCGRAANLACPRSNWTPARHVVRGGGHLSIARERTQMKPIRRSAAAVAVAVTATAGLLVGSGILAGTANAAATFIGLLNTETVVASTVPANGDVNPYGVAVVPHSTGNLQQGNVLVSNFNNAANVQGTGTTIVQVTPAGHASLFAQIGNLGGACPGGVGLTTALVALTNGWVIVGSLPTQNGAISGPSCLTVLDSPGMVRETLPGHGT